jgi:hypothetical protein
VDVHGGSSKSDKTEEEKQRGGSRFHLVMSLGITWGNRRKLKTRHRGHRSADVKESRREQKREREMGAEWLRCQVCSLKV